ncbi:Metallo-dependent phosphatase-like protein, partial [Dimargaris cristalligena]
YRIAIIADPQITDYYSYRHTGLLLSLTNFFTDQYATKNYWYLLQAQRPDAVLILGDLFDGGRHWEDELGDPPASVLPAYHYRPLFRYVAGNHDIGVGATIIPAAVTRFIREFGPLNYRWSVAGHDLLILDNLSLENTSIPELAANSTAFLDQMEREILSTMAPRLLFTHIPLYRPPHTDCGPRRNRGHEINQKFGFQYQNLVREPITNRILRQTQPEVVFTGDDHDQCEVTHTISPPPLSQLDRDEVNRTIPEYTLGSYSMAGGNTRPSYTLLTLHH